MRLPGRGGRPADPRRRPGEPSPPAAGRGGAAPSGAGGAGSRAGSGSRGSGGSRGGLGPRGSGGGSGAAGGAGRRPSGPGLRRTSRDAGAKAAGPGSATPPAPVAPVAGGGERRVTSRALWLAVVVIAAVVTLAVPVREYLAQRGQIDALRAEQRAAQARVAALQKQHQAWTDPATIAAQAKARLLYQKPGETMLVPLTPSPAPAVGGAPSDVLPSAGALPWYQTLWDSVASAGAAPAPAPAAGEKGAGATPQPPTPTRSPAPLLSPTPSGP